MDLFTLMEGQPPRKDDRAEEVAALRSQIARHQELYHNQDAPEVSDEEYDGLVRREAEIVAERPDLEDENSPSKRVAPPLTGELPEVRHAVPMLSLDNAFTDEDADDFVRRVRADLGLTPEQVLVITAEPKIDGLSCSIRYENGSMRLALTRGTGTVGEIVTENVATIADVPSTIEIDGKAPAVFEVRGEVYMPKTMLERLNEDHRANGRKTIANTRNGAAGALRRKDPAETAKSGLRFIAYGLGETSGTFATNQEELVTLLAKLGFSTSADLSGRGIDAQGIVSVYRRIEAARPDLEFDIDGVVYKVNDFAQRQELGQRSRTPLWGIAHKFAAERVQTRVLSIDIQVGRTGRLTPVARLAPVSVGGVVVTNATLHNEDEMARLDVRVGDLVILQRAGDVIPQIVGLAPMEDGEHEARSSFEMPHSCPVCGSHAEREPDEVDRRCVAGLTCPAQATARFVHMVSRETLDIDGIGSESVTAFVQAGLLTEPADIYDLPERRSEILSLEGWGPNKYDALAAGIAARRSPPSNKLLQSLGIRHVGNEATRLLGERYRTLDAILTAFDALSLARSEARSHARATGDWGGNKKTRYDEKRFEHELAKDLAGRLAIPKVGPEVVTSLLDFLDDEASRAALGRLLQRVTPTSVGTDVVEDSPVAGRTVVFTGSMEVDRKMAEAHARSLGANPTGSVSKNTDILIHGPGAGSKLKKATDLGTIQILTEQEWFGLVGLPDPR